MSMDYLQYIYIYIYIYIYSPKNTGLIIGDKSTTNMYFVSLILGAEPRELLAYQQIYSSNSKLNPQCQNVFM
jgi:hypothetical protein